jgi:tetratricopeptide (TPR) repeat protein
VTPRNATAVAALCHHLDGIPLAMELAAARIQIMTPAQMVAGLSRRFDFLVSRRRDVQERHGTMRAAIEWSFRLLTPELRRLFAQLSVFCGGWTLEAARQVCGNPNILDELDPLCVSSLIYTYDSPAGMRFNMLETLREFAGEHLPASEQREIARRHLYWCLNLVERQAGGQKPDELWLEFDNCRAALAWCLRPESDAAEEALRLAVGMDWGTARADRVIRGSMTEARRWLERVLACSQGCSAPLRAMALRLAARMAFWQGDYETSAHYHEERAELYRAAGDADGLCVALQSLAAIATEQGDYASATPVCAEALAIARGLGVRHRLGMALIAAGELARIQGDYAKAKPLFEGARDCMRDLDTFEYAYSVLSLAYVAQRQGEPESARDQFREALSVWYETENVWGVSIGLVGYGGVLVDGDPERTARIFGAAETIRAQIGFPMQKADRADYEISLAALRKELDEVTLTALWREGGAMSWQQAAAHALGEDRK